MTGPRRRPARALVDVHLVLIAAVALYALVSATFYASPDVNFGLFFAAIGFVVLGVPWSLLVFLVPSDQLGMVQFEVAGVAGTLVNLALHFALRRRRSRRTATADEASARI